MAIKRERWIIRDTQAAPERWYAGGAHTLFTLDLWEFRRKHALQYVDSNMAGIKAQELKDRGHCVVVELY